MILEFQGKRPQIGRRVFIAHNAVVAGDVVLADDVSVWFGAVIRADKGQVRIGRGSNVQDNAVVHLTHDPALDTVLGENVTIGHGAVVEGCVIEDGALIGMNAVVLPGAVVGAGSVIAAGAVVREGTVIPAGVLAAGTPAVVKKPISGRSLEQTQNAPRNYQRLKGQYPPEAGEYFD